MEAIENFLIPFPYKVAKAMDPLTYRYLNLFSVFKFTFTLQPAEYNWTLFKWMCEKWKYSFCIIFQHSDNVHSSVRVQTIR
jgi:hypothetical protein